MNTRVDGTRARKIVTNAQHPPSALTLTLLSRASLKLFAPTNRDDGPFAGCPLGYYLEG